MFFEITWGKTMKRWVDVCSVNNYNISDKSARHVFDRKTYLSLKCKHSWPRHASFEEDKYLRDPMWTSKHGDVRLIMWDDTNIDFKFKPSLVHIQRLTCSSYYGGNCAKG